MNKKKEEKKFAPSTLPEGIYGIGMLNLLNNLEEEEYKRNKLINKQT